MKRLIGPLLALVLGGCVTTTAPNPAPPAAADAPPHVQLATWTSQRLPPPLTTRRPRVSSDPLDSFFQALSDLEAGRLDTVTVVQIGDSHTANDRFSGRIRELMQARFGNAGRGMLAPGNPYNGFRPTQVTVTSRGWRPIPSWPGKPGTPIGLTGFQAQADRPGDVMAVEPKDDSRFDVLGVGILRQPGGGTLVVRADGVEVARIATAGAETSTAQMRLDLDHPTRRLELSPAGDGPVTVLSWTVLRQGHGVVWDSHGVVGSRIGILDRWDPRTVADELAVRNPSLVVLAYGTNDGFEDDLNPLQFAADLTRHVNALRAMAPNAAILLVAPPGSARLPSGCPGAMRSDVRYGCAELTADEERNYAALFKVKRPRGKVCRWHSPPKLATVRAVQHKVAPQLNVGLWDWSEVIEPNCGVHRWIDTVPPLARGDHVHLTPDGYAVSGEAMFNALMRRYDAWKIQARGSETLNETR